MIVRSAEQQNSLRKTFRKSKIAWHKATHRKDNVRAVDVPLSVEAIGQLGLYASLRDMGLVELIAQVLGEAIKKDLVGKILDDIPPKP